MSEGNPNNNINFKEKFSPNIKQNGSGAHINFFSNESQDPLI
jgi:hypothetical protein